jgi:hypothetical protein
MGIELWGPALDAEVAYRREQVAAGVRRAREVRRPGVARGARGARSTPGTTGATGTTGRPVVRAPGRRWSLRGSGAWHVAR